MSNRGKAFCPKVLLRSAGLRATKARIAILDLMFEANRPLSHAEVNELMSDTGADRSTVFRALLDMTQSGLLRRMELGDHVWRFEHACSEGRLDSDTPSHPHLFCVDCGSVTCVSKDDVELRLAKTLLPIESVVLRGQCCACRQRS